MENVKMTNNEYQLFLKANASKIYKPGDYSYKNYCEDAEKVEVLPFEINSENQILKILINIHCITEEKREGSKLYRGSLNIDSVHRIFTNLNMKQIEDNGYGGSYYNDDSLLLVGYAEGDLNFTVCDNVESYSKEKNRTIEWYKKNN